MNELLSQLVGHGYGAAWALSGTLPESLTTAAVNRAAAVALRRRGPGTVQLAKNLKRVLGPSATPETLHAVTGAALRSYGRYWQETFRLPVMDLDRVTADVIAGTTGLEDVTRAQEAGRGVVMVLPHSGNWDVAGLMICRLFGGLVTVAERLKPESVFRRFVEHREALGFEVLPLTGGDRPTFQVLKERLVAGRILCLVGDRDLDGGGIDVDFFGEPTTMPGGQAMLAALTGADLLPSHLSYTDGGWTTRIGAPLELVGTRLRERTRSGTQQIADFFAENIAEHPADWHMLQPFWTADRPAATAAKAAGPS